MSPPPDIAAHSFEDGQDDVKEEYCGLRSGFEVEEGEEDAEFYQDDWNDYEDEYGEDMEDWESCCSSEGSENLQLWPDPFDQGTEASSAPRTPSPSSLAGPSSQVDNSSVHWWQANPTSLSVGLKVVCLSRPPETKSSEVLDSLLGDFELAPSGYSKGVHGTVQLHTDGQIPSPAATLPAEGQMSGDFRSCPASYWAAFHQKAWPNARRRSEGEKVLAPSKVIVGPKAGPRLVFSRRAHPRRPPGRQERRPGSRPTSRSLGAKAGAGATRPSKEEPVAANAGLECRAAKTPCYEVNEEEFERLWLSGSVAPPIAVGEEEDVYEIPEEDFDRLLKAGQLQLAKEDDFEVTRRTIKRSRHPEEVLVSTLPAPPVAKPMPPSTAPTPGRRYTEPMTARPCVAESKKTLTTFPLTLERSLWSEAMLPRAVGSPARLLRGLRASISGSVVPLTETEAVARSTAASSSEVDDAPMRRLPAGRLPRMPWEAQAMRKSSYSSTDAGGESGRSSPVQTLRTLAPLDVPFSSHEDCG